MPDAQTLFPVIGSVSLLGFALVYHNRTFLYIALGMVVMMVGFSLARPSGPAPQRAQAGRRGRTPL